MTVYQTITGCLVANSMTAEQSTFRQMNWITWSQMFRCVIVSGPATYQKLPVVHLLPLVAVIIGIPGLHPHCGESLCVCDEQNHFVSETLPRMDASKSLLNSYCCTWLAEPFFMSSKGYKSKLLHLWQKKTLYINVLHITNYNLILKTIWVLS